ncbi:DUF6273 domain-containing protein [Anaerolentibacter hominis]|uniref:DUF6273 domain-containing protein n=1 Tax=Anaerolentibacter hominis TaxID=3079009 RepID=UPI0031B8AD22
MSSISRLPSGGGILGSIDPVLDNNTWTQIKVVAAAGQGPNYWAVGDCKGVEINGWVSDGLTLSGTYYCFILGFDHNSEKEGTGIHFQFGKTALTGGTDIAFTDSEYGKSGGTVTYLRMNWQNSNSGGWGGSEMRKNICSPFLSKLPTDMQSAIAFCQKYSDNTGGGSNTASYVTATSDKIWLLSEFEVHGTRSYANSAEQNYQKQYDYYKNGNSKVKYRHNSTSSACAWWLRSVWSNSGIGFCAMKTDGSAGSSGASNSVGFAPGFKIG